MTQNQSISLQLTVDEINAILSLLGEKPYVQVFELVHKIQQQAGAQVQQLQAPLNGEVEARQKEVS